MVWTRWFGFWDSLNKRVCYSGVPPIRIPPYSSDAAKLVPLPVAQTLRNALGICVADLDSAVFFRRNPYGFPQGFFIPYPEGKKQLPDSGCKIFHLTYCWMLQKSHKQLPTTYSLGCIFKPVANHGDFSGSQPPSTGPIKAVLGVPEKSRDRQLWQLLVWVGRGLLVWRPCSSETFRWPSHHPLVLASTTVCVS